MSEKEKEENIKSDVLTAKEARKKELKKKIKEKEEELKVLRDKLKALEALEKKEAVVYVSHNKNNAQFYQSEML